MSSYDEEDSTMLTDPSGYIGERVRLAADFLEIVSNEMSTCRTEAEKAERRREILDLLESTKSQVNSSFEAIKGRVERDMPKLDETQQNNLVETASKFASFVTQLFSLFDDVVDKVTKFFERTAQRMYETYRDFQRTIRDCVTLWRNWCQDFVKNVIL